MAVEARPELVGKRFVCASGSESLELGGISRWNWRAGVIRAVSTRDADSPGLAVCVEWDGDAAAERHWRRLKEEWEVFVLEHELVWAKRRNTTLQENSSLQPALIFQPLIGQALVGGASVVEFLSDRQLEFYTEQEELRPYEQGEVDDPALREDSSSREQVQAWLRQRQLQHILQLGHSCVKGLRVKVFRHDSKPQWLSGIVSHHDHNSRTMTVLSDQVSVPLNVDQELMQVVFLDDISQLLLKGETSTTTRKPRTSKINRTVLNTVNRSNNTTETDQAYSSGPVQRKQPQLCRQDSNCSPAEDEAEEMREEKRADEVRADSSKSRMNQGEKKRRKEEDAEEEEEEKRNVGLKRLKGGCRSDLSDGSDLESDSCMQQETSCDMGPKSLQKKLCASNRPADWETGHSPARHMGQDFKARSSPKGGDLSPNQLAQLEGVRKSPPSQFHLPGLSCNGTFRDSGVPELQCTVGPGCDKIEEERGDRTIEMEDRSEGASQEDSEAVSALLASQESEQLVSMETACVLLHTSPPECGGVEGDQENPPSDPEVRGSASTHPEVVTPHRDSAASVEEEPRGPLTHSPITPCDADVDAGKGAKLSQSPGNNGPEHEAVPPSEISHKPTEYPSPCSSPEIISNHSVVTEVSRMRRNASPEAARIKESSCKSTTEKAPIGLKSTPGPKVTCTSVLNCSHALTPTPTDQPTQSRTPPQHLSSSLDKPTKSPLIIDRNEPFTIYRDPALVRKELENHPSYIQPAHTPPNPNHNPHPKHQLKNPSPSSSSPNLTSTSSHSKILSPTPHLSPLSLPSQSSLCSPHPSIPHPHLLPSLLPGLPPSTALLAGHTRLGPLGLPHHPLALQATPSLLGQSPGTSHLAPLGLYPLLWPPFSNGTHNYGLGLQGSKWTPPENAGMSEANLRRNTPSPWLPQPTPVTSAESQGLRPPLPVRPSSADPQRMSRTVQPSTPTSKTTEELERRTFTETQSCVHTPIKAEQERVHTVGKNGSSYRPVAAESPSDRSKQPQVVYDLTGDRTSRYQEESRRILKESIEVAPFTAKLGSDRDPRYPKSPTLHSKERERERETDKELEREMHVFRHNLPARPQSAYPSPTLTQTNYYTPVTGGVENKSSARRAPPSKELYERLSGPNTAASVLHSPSTQSIVKARPPHLVKRHPEKEEGLLGKIAEQLACKANSVISVEPVEHSSIERKGSSSSLISLSNSSSRAVPSLHRAPIFHPPAPPIMASKEVGQGRLSPPTLTPIQPMSLSGKAQNQHRPPTLMPELRHGAVAGKRAAPEPMTVTSQAYDFQKGVVLHNRERVVGGHTTNGGVVTPQSATASVIVRPSSYVHTPVNYSVCDRSLPRPHCEHVQTFESVPNTHLKESSVQCKRGVLWTPMDTVHPINMVTSKQESNAPLNMTTKNMSTTHFPNRAIKYSASIDTAHSRVDLMSEQGRKDEVRTVQPKFDLSSTPCCPTRDLPHVKKRRAGLAAPEPRHNTHTVQPLHTTHTLNSTKSVSHTSHSRYSTYTTHSTHTICSAHALERDKESMFTPSPPKCPRLFSEGTTVRVTNKPASVAKSQPQAPPPNTSQPAQSVQSNYHKLKKAWLTRHSEQDRGNATSQTAGCSQMDTTLTTTSTVSLPAKQEVNGLENKWFNQEGKECSLDNRKSKSLDRRCSPEDRKSNRIDTKSKTENKKPVVGDRKTTLEDVKPVLDRNGNNKKPGSRDKNLCVSERKPCPVTIKTEKDNRGDKQMFQSSFESGDSGNEIESRKCDPGGKRQLKPMLIKKQNDQQKKRGENDKEEDEDEEEEEGKLNGTARTTKEKSQHRLPNSNGIPRSVLKDWRKVKKLKQSGEAFLQDDSCAEIGANVQKCRECRLDRSRKAQEPAVSPVFCRFYYFRRLSYSKNGVVRVDGFSVAEQTDEDAVKVWMSGFEDAEDEDKTEMDLNMAKYVLTLIGDQFCQLVKTENIAVTWVKKDNQVMWKRAVRGVREMCDACEATLFNMHWACHKCGFVVCMDCYKARERRSAKDKELYVWVRCVKNQPHDLKNLMPTQIVPEIVLAGLQSSMHSIRRDYGIPSHCSCSGGSVCSKPITTNGLSQLSADSKSQRSLPQVPEQRKSAQGAAHKTPTEKRGKPECDGVEALGRKSNSPEQGSTLRDLLTSTAGKLRLGSSGPGIAFAPVYNNSDQNTQNARMPNLLDDIIASVVENKIPASKMTKLGLKQDLLIEEEAELGLEAAKSNQIPLADPHASVPHDWLGIHQLLWLKDHRHLGNHRLFKENWTQGQPVLVSGLNKSLNASLWKPEHFSREFSALHSDIYNCRDGSITNSRVKEFWDGFEDVSKRPRSPKGDPAVYRLKDWPSGEEFLALMPSRYEDVMSTLPVPEYTGPDGSFNLASRLPSFFIRPDLGPRLCCAHGVTACPEQDFGTSNLHVEISDTMSILVYVGIAKGNGALSKTGVLKLLEREVLDDCAKKRLRESNEAPGALWHIFLSKDLHKIQDFLQALSAEHAEADVEGDSDAEWDSETDPLREGGWYLSPRLRQRLLEEHGVESRTLLQFYGDAVIIPAGALHQVMNLHSCIQVNVDFVSPEHAYNSYYLTQELRPLKDQVNYEDKLQVKNIIYHSVKDAVATLSRYSKEQNTLEEIKEEES